MKRLILALATLLLLASCGYDDTVVPGPKAAPEAPPSSAAPPPQCGDPTRSYDPNGSVEALSDGPTVEEIRERGRLVAGVSADSYLLASRNPINGEIEGFDIDMVHAIARAIFPGEPVENVVTLRVITAADRLTALMEERVDIVARNMTINCVRWGDIAFSAVYYQSGQKLLVRKDLAEQTNPVDSVEELAGLRVCAPRGTTSLANIVEVAPDDTEIVEADTHTGCLVLFQRGEADAITGDDTVLAGLAAQDPYAIVPTGQRAFTEEPYGIGVNEQNRDLVRFINAVLEEMRPAGTWQDSYDRWLKPELGNSGQPLPTYGR